MARPRRRAGIVGMGTCVPERVLTNHDLERMVDTSDEWIVARTGIRERRIADPATATSDLAVGAARRALAEAGVGPEEVELIVVATATPDMLFPSTACLVQDRLGARRAGAFDLAAACSGFIYGLAIAAQFIESGVYDTVLVIGAETLSRFVDWSDRSTCVLFGDAAGAAVLRPVGADEGVLGFHLGADGSGGDLIQLPAGGSRRPASPETLQHRLHYIRMNGREVFRFAVRTMAEAAQAALERCGLEFADVDLVVPHQANLRIITACAERFGLPMERVYVNIDRFGNTSAASIPVALDEACSAGRLRPGQVALLVAFGAGLTCGAAVVRWTLARAPGGPGREELATLAAGQGEAGGGIPG